MFENLPCRKPVTRDEWYNSPEFIILRMLNNLAAETGSKASSVYDVLNLLVTARPDLYMGDKFNLVERQLRIVSLEASKLWDRIRDLEHMLAPRDFTDLVLTPSTSDSESTKQPPQQDQHPG